MLDTFEVNIRPIQTSALAHCLLPITTPYLHAHTRLPHPCDFLSLLTPHWADLQGPCLRPSHILTNRLPLPRPLAGTATKCPPLGLTYTSMTIAPSMDSLTLQELQHDADISPDSYPPINTKWGLLFKFILPLAVPPPRLDLHI